MPDPQVSVTGHLCMDYILTVDEFPKPGTSRLVVDRQIYYGGGAANIAVGIAKLGGRPELITTVGRDFPDSRYAQYLQDAGVSLRAFSTTERNCSTAFMVNTVAGEQVTYFEWGAAVLFETTEAPALEFVHMATGSAVFNVQAARKAKFASFDPGQDVQYYSAEQLKDLFAHIDLLICNNFESEIMCGKLGWTEEELIAAVPMTILTRGKEGSMLFCAGDAVAIPAVSVPMADPTGAGDAYRAGFFTAFRRGYAVPVCCRIGAVTSSFAVEKVGTQTNLPDWSQMAGRYADVFGTLKKSE